MHPILWAPHTSFSSQASIYNNFNMPFFFFFFTFQLYTFVYAISIFWTISSSSTWKTPIYPTVPCSTSPLLRDLFWWLGQSLAPPLHSLYLTDFSMFILPLKDSMKRKLSFPPLVLAGAPRRSLLPRKLGHLCSFHWDLFSPSSLFETMRWMTALLTCEQQGECWNKEEGEENL